jgi:hypothetical protein
VIDSPAVLVLLLAAFAAVPLLLHRVRAASPDGVRVVGRTALSKGSVVAVVAVGPRRLLVGAGERGVHLIAELDAEPDDTSAGASSVAPSDHPRTAGSVVVPDLVTTSGMLVVPDHGAAPAGTAASTIDTLPGSLDRTDAAATGIHAGSTDDALAALADLELERRTSVGPGNGLVDRLRAMTVRTPVQGRPFHVPLRR